MQCAQKLCPQAMVRGETMKSMQMKHVKCCTSSRPLDLSAGP
jgi:hypothetical protein